jgi:tellurium resistance protein TerD
MTKLKLELTKEGQEAPKLKLNLSKGSRFFVELYWDTENDLDVFAFLCNNDGSGPKYDGSDKVLGWWDKNNIGNGKFATPCGSLIHSGDCTDGSAEDIDECITIDGSKVPAGINEIPICVNSYDGDRTFRNVKDAGVRIKDESGKVHGEYELTNAFADFQSIQMGSLVLDGDGWSFKAEGRGFKNTDHKAMAKKFQKKKKGFFG